ncbi:MAG: Hsp70 family protein [Pseudomonadota bacterium]
MANAPLPIGIDLGTTYSACAVFRNGATQIVPNALGESLTPSVVGLDDDGALLVGRPARERLISHPPFTSAFFKRIMGSNAKVMLGDRRRREFSATELASLVLRSLKEDAERLLGLRPKAVN